GRRGSVASPASATPACPRGRPGAARSACRPATGASTIHGPGLLAKLLVEDLADEAVDRNRIEAHVGGHDDAGIYDLAPRQLLEDALDVPGRVPLLAPDLELLALERYPRGWAEAEPPRDQPLVHQLRLIETLAVRRARAGANTG